MFPAQHQTADRRREQLAHEEFIIKLHIFIYIGRVTTQAFACFWFPQVAKQGVI